MIAGFPRYGRFDDVARGIGHFGRVVLHETLDVHGWMLSRPDLLIASFALYVDGDLVATTGARPSAETPLPPRLLPGVATFFAFEGIDLGFIPREFARIEVLACVAGDPVARIATPLRDLESVPTPPEHLMLRVTGNSDPLVVKAAGLRCAGEFLDTLVRHRPLQSLRRVLEWGCGCGRATAHLIEALAPYPDVRVDACDIDAEAVRWADSNIRSGTFMVVEPYPPLPWNDATFDAVFACSLFTHLSGDAQAAWLAEMERVITPGGMLLASICSGGEADFSDEPTDPALDGIAPAGYYRGAIQSRAYALAEWSAWFDIAEFIENGLESSQDLVVMRRRVESAKPPRAAEPPNYQDGSAQVDGPAQVDMSTVRLREQYPPGHLHSPIPSAEDVERAATRPSTLRGIDLRHDAQLTLFHELKRYYPELPFGQRQGLRYSFDNPDYGYSDAIILYSMIRHLRPLSIIGVGSGYSSCVMLDTIELFFGGAVDCTFIDPAAELLASLLKPGDSPRIIADRVQDVPESVFTTLRANDILLIDSTHVLKAGSDVNHLLFEILPILSSGVFIHFHDVFHPFEYPPSWFRDLGLAWNEIYALRAFLQYNEQFEIALSNTYLEQLHEDLFRAEMPLCLVNPGGSLWVRRR